MLERVKDWLGKAGLELNLTKTQITNMRQKAKINFSGFELSERKSKSTGKRYIDRQLSKASTQRYRDKVRAELNHRNT